MPSDLPWSYPAPCVLHSPSWVPTARHARAAFCPAPPCCAQQFHMDNLWAAERRKYRDRVFSHPCRFAIEIHCHWKTCSKHFLAPRWAGDLANQRPLIRHRRCRHLHRSVYLQEEAQAPQWIAYKAHASPPKWSTIASVRVLDSPTIFSSWGHGNWVYLAHLWIIS